MPSTTNDQPVKKSKLRCRAHGNMAEWLAQSGGSLVITTYTSGLLVLVSSFEERLRFRSRRFARPMGIAIHNDQLAIAVRQQVLLYKLANPAAEKFGLKRTYNTGKVNAHDVAFGDRGIYFANTRFNAITRVSPNKNFIHCWQPTFIEGFVRGDRCHLNGLAVKDGRPNLATAFCATGHKGGWREQDRFTGGVVIDVEHNEVVTTGLCMPHSPRWHDDRWWLCNSGHGLLSTLDPDNWQRTDICELPGFTRGLCLVGDHALVGLSKIRPKHILDAPPVRERHPQLTAGVALVDLRTGNHTGTLEFLERGNEVYEVLFLPGIRKPDIKSPKPPAKA